MKKRKVKLLASIASLVLVFAVMSIGVWAAATQSVSVSTKVTFTATGVSGTISGTLTGLDSTTYYYNSTNATGGNAINFSPSSAVLPAWNLGTDNALTINATEGQAADIVYSFTITNSSTTDAMVAAITNLTVGTNLEIVSVTQDDQPVTETTGTYNLTNIAVTDSSVVVVTIGVTNDAVSISEQNIGFSVDLSSVNA